MASQAAGAAGDAAGAAGEGPDVGRQILDNQVAAEREQYQPTAMEKVFSIAKSMIMRAMVIYFIMSFFRRPAQTPPTGPDGKPAPVKGVASNLFPNGTVFDLYVYVSEAEKDFGDFNVSGALVWSKKGLEYGDWYSGPDGDATYSHSVTIPATTVSRQLMICDKCLRFNLLDSL